MAGLTGNVDLISAGIQYALFIVFTCVTYLFIDSERRQIQYFQQLLMYSQGREGGRF